MNYYVLNLKTFKTVVASSKSEAENLGNGSIIFSSAEELARDPNTTGQVLCRAFNEMSPVQVDRFADKVSGSKRLFKMAESSSPKNEFYGHKFGNSVEEKTAASVDEMELYREKTPKDTSSVEKSTSPKGGKFAGKIITCLVDENPRTKKTGHGFNSMQILIEDKKLSGPAAIMQFEDYIAKGGRSRDLQWDLDNGHVSVE